GWDDLVGEAVGEIDRVQQAEGGGGEQVLLLAAPHRTPHQQRGIPLGEERLVAARQEPAVEQAELGRLAGPVDAFDDDELAGIRMRLGQHRRVSYGPTRNSASSPSNSSSSPTRWRASQSSSAASPPALSCRLSLAPRRATVTSRTTP